MPQEKTPTSSSPEQKKSTSRYGENTKVDTDTFEIVGVDTGTVFGKGSSLAEAIALQTQGSSGGTPTVSGRPDLYGVAPLEGEAQAPVNIADAGQPEQMVAPRVATSEELAAKKAGTLQTAQADRGTTPPPTTPESDKVVTPEGPKSYADTMSDVIKAGAETGYNNAMNAPGGYDNQILQQKGIMMAALLGDAVTPEDLRWLSPQQQAAVRSGKKAAIEAQLVGLNAIVQGRKDMKKEAEEKALRQYELFAKSGTAPEDLPQDFLNKLDAQLGLPQGTFSDIYKSDYAQNEDEKLVASLDAAMKLDTYLGSQPSGTTVKIGDSTFLGTGRGTAEINSITGDVYMQVADPTSPVGFTYIKTGNIGSNGGDIKKITDANGNETFWSINNGVATPVNIGGGSGAGLQADTLMTDFPEGQGFSVDENGVNESWCLQFGYAIAEPGSIPYSVDGISMDYIAAKKAWADPSITTSNVSKGDWILTNESKKYGHIALVTDVQTNPTTGERTAILAESNSSGYSGKVHYGRSIALTDDNMDSNGGIIMGFHNADLKDRYESQATAGTTAGGQLTSYTGGGSKLFNELLPGQQLEARKLAVDAYGKRSGNKLEILNTVASLMSQGQTADQISDQLRFSGDSELFTGAYRDIAENLSFSMSEAKSESFFNTLDRHLEDGNLDKAAETIKIAANSSLSSEERQVATAKDRTVQFLQEIESDLSEYERLGGDTGLFKGKIQKMQEKVGRQGNSNLARIGTKIATAVQKYRHDLSGAAFSVQEAAEYASIFPSIDKTSELNTQKISALKEVFTGDLDFIYSESMGVSGYTEIFGDDGIGAAYRNSSSEASSYIDSLDL